MPSATTFDVSNPDTPTIIKDPDAQLDYTFDWSTWLGTDTIQSAAITATAGITVLQSSSSATKVIVWLGGGVEGRVYSVTCRITTVASRVDDRTFFVRVQSR